MLPFLAQGAAMAIEDAAVLASCLAAQPTDPPAAMRRYEAMRRGAHRARPAGGPRQRPTYHLAGPPAFARNLAMRLMGGNRLRARYDWLYDWRPD